MKKTIILFTLLFLLWGCEKEEDPEPKEGACVYWHYISLEYQIKYCRFKFEDECDLEHESFKGEESTCQNEGYTKGCGTGKLVAEEEDC